MKIFRLKNVGKNTEILPEHIEEMPFIPSVESPEENQVLTWENGKWVAKDNVSEVDMSFNANRPITRAVSGLNGVNLGTATIQDTLEALLYPYAPPTITLTSAPSTIVREIGVPISNITLTTTVVKNTLNLQFVRYFVGNTIIYENNSINPNGGAYSYVYTPNISTTTTFTSTVFDGQTTTTSNNRTYTFVYPFYAGVGVVNLNEMGIRGLTKILETKSNKTIVYSPNNQRIYFSYPQSYGPLTSIKDQNNFDITSGFVLSTQTFTMEDNNEVIYNIYMRTADVTVSNFSITFNF